MSLANYQLSLPASSGTWTYSPNRWGPPEQTWNASYTGETSWPYGNDYRFGDGSFYFRTQATGSQVGMEFAGTGVRLCVKDNDATYTVTLNSSVITPNVITDDKACKELGAAQAVLIQDLDFANHNVNLLITSTSSLHEFQFFGGILETKILVDSQTLTVDNKTIDDRDSGWDILRQANRAWDESTGLGLYQGTASFTCIWTDSNAGSATYTFKGASAVLLNSGGADTYTVIFDGKTTVSNMAAPNWNLKSTPMFWQTNLDPSQSHTITLMNYDPNDKRCSHQDGTMAANELCCTRLDSLQLFGSKVALEGGAAPSLDTTTPSSETTTPSSSSAPGLSSTAGVSQSTSTPQINDSPLNVAAVAGVVVGGTIVCALVCLILVLLYRRRKRDRDQPVMQSYNYLALATPSSSHPSTHIPSPSTAPASQLSYEHQSPFGPDIVVSRPSRSNESGPASTMSTAEHPSKGGRVLAQRDQLSEGPSAKVRMWGSPSEAGIDSLPPYSATRDGWRGV